VGIAPARLALAGLICLLPRPAPAADAPDDRPAAIRFDRLDRLVRDGGIDRAEARRDLHRLLPELAAQFRAAGCRTSPRDQWVFPLAGYGPGAVGGRQGSGYQPEGYDYFDGNRHGGHPAHDLFIADRDQDGRDDRTHAPVAVRSVSSGLVAAVNPTWEAGSAVRGGIYVWVYDPDADALLYYAHLRETGVRPGDCVVAGSPLGAVGRTGAKAYPRRSPTHLHFSAFTVVDGAPTPRNPYRDLLRARRTVPPPPPAPMAAAPAKAQYPWRAPQAAAADALAARFAPPPGYARVAAPAGSFAAWLRGLPLRAPGAPVLLHDGRRKRNQDVHVAVVDIDTGKRDLQQCADACIRLRAEYLYAQARPAAIHFKFTSGHDAAWPAWAAGQRPVVEGNSVRWARSAKPDASYPSFRQYLDVVFRYAGTLSLRKEMAPVPRVDELQPGDVFVIGGSPGHAVMVVDVAANAKTGAKVFLLAQSYMPAQDVHVLKNPTDAALSPWYPAAFGAKLVTPEWTFGPGDLRRFRE
jgi:hypothetical protein